MTASRLDACGLDLLGAALWVAIGGVVFLCGCDGHPTLASGSHASPDTYEEVDWERLIPADELENHRLAVAFAMRNIDHSSDERTPQFGSFKTDPELNGRRVSLSGYVVPLEADDDGAMTDFFFVPTMGACIHVPPPPPDQMIYVHLAKAIPQPEIGEAATLKGTLRTSTHDADVASAAYSMDDARLTPKPMSR